MKSKDFEIFCLRRQVSELKAQKHELESMTSERRNSAQQSNQISELTERLNTQNEVIRQKDNQLRNYEREITLLRDEIREKNELIRALEQNVESLQGELVSLRQAVNRHENLQRESDRKYELMVLDHENTKNEMKVLKRMFSDLLNAQTQAR